LTVQCRDTRAIVTTGLDPVVHAVRLRMDARVKPGHDENENGTLQ